MYEFREAAASASCSDSVVHGSMSRAVPAVIGRSFAVFAFGPKDIRGTRCSVLMRGRDLGERRIAPSCIDGKVKTLERHT